MAILTFSLLSACTLSGFKPPTETTRWTIPDNNLELKDFIKERNKAMRECGVDPYVGNTNVPEKRACLESKGWRNVKS